MLIDARNVTKAFGAFKAVDDASVSVEATYRLPVARTPMSWCAWTPR